MDKEVKSAREELTQKLLELLDKRIELVSKYLPEDKFEEYTELTARIENLKNHLEKHSDEYLEKDRAFDRSRCPYVLSEDGGCLADSPNFRGCEMQECPDYDDCPLRRKFER